jgi:hypothetical protein
MCVYIGNDRTSDDDDDDNNFSFISTASSFFPSLSPSRSSLPQNELQMALPNVDLSKLSKLRQRLVAPSLFSTQYLFPGNQAFFRDFIICCDFHMMFTEQLKIALISELLQMNDSSMETLSIARGNGSVRGAAATAPTIADDDNKEKSSRQEFIVSAQTLKGFIAYASFIISAAVISVECHRSLCVSCVRNIDILSSSFKFSIQIEQWVLR